MGWGREGQTWKFGEHTALTGAMAEEPERSSRVGAMPCKSVEERGREAAPSQTPRAFDIG